MTNPNNTSAAMVEVTQSDRDAAWPLRPSCYKDNPQTRHNWRNGVYDKLPAIQAFARHRLSSLSAQPVAPAVAGWIVGNGDGSQWRKWEDGWSSWTPDRNKATQYARRQDAEAVHREDEDAWTIVPYDEQPVGDR